MKNFIKSNIAVVVTVLVIFAGGSALAVYSNVGGDTVQPYTAITDKDGNIKDIKRGKVDTAEPIQEITKEQFDQIEAKGRNNFQLINGQVKKKPTPNPKRYKYIVTYNADGNLIDVLENTGEQAGQFVEITEGQKADIDANGKDKFKIIEGKLSRQQENTSGSSARKIETWPDGTPKWN